MAKLLNVKKLFTTLLSVIIMYLTVCGGQNYSGKVLLVGFDGFRWDYMSFTETPHLDLFAKEGTTVPYINNVFTSITFPSMYSIVTGLYPESHGIVGYSMYDPVFNDTWNHTNTQSRWYEDGEPIWVTAKKQHRRTASYMWLGSAVKIRGHRPDFWHIYNESHSFEDRVEEAVRWFKDDDVDVVTLYFHEPDSIGHISGPAPNSPHTIDMIKEVDRSVGYLMDRFKETDLSDTVNILITSDHGMTESSLENKVIEIYRFVAKEDIQIIADEGAVANILPANGKLETVYNALKCAHANMTVYYKEDMPTRWHYQHHRRILPLLVVADEGWLAVGNVSTWEGPLLGMHGHDNALMNMKPFFLAKGPNIRRSFKSEVFNQVDIYPLMCELLDIKPSANNGSLDIVRKMLKPNPFSSQALKNQPANICLMLTIMSIYLISVVYL